MTLTKILCVLLLSWPVVASAQNHPRTQGSLHPALIQHEGSTDERETSRGHRDSSFVSEPIEQCPADMDLTRRIRRAVLDDESLSTYAHNVQIIARNGQVTLRGPVRSSVEKVVLEQKAASVVGRENVKNEVEVSPVHGQ